MSINNYISPTKPVQRISINKKIGNSKEAKDWRQQNLDYFSTSNTSDYESLRNHFRKLYLIASGKLVTEDYKHVLNSIVTKNKRSKSKNNSYIPKNFDIVTPLLMLMLGEKIEKFVKPIVVALNSDIDVVKDERAKEIVNSEIDKIVTNSLNEDFDTGIPEQEVKSPEKIIDEINRIKDEKTIRGSNALEFIISTKDIQRKIRKSFYNWIVTGCTFSIKDVRFDDIEYEPINPLNLKAFSKSENTHFLEDGESACVEFIMTLSDVIDQFNDDLEEKEIERLEEQYALDNSGQRTLYYESGTVDLYNSLCEDNLISGRNIYTTSGNVEVLYVNWKSLTKIGRLKRIVNGKEEIDYVDENYKPSEFEEIDYRWVNQVWEGWKIGRDIYVGIRPVPFERGVFDNPSKCKLLINGCFLIENKYRTLSPVEKIKPFQEKINIIHWHLEKVINKNKDKIVVTPLGLIPDNEDLNMFDMLYYADQDSFFFIDEAKSDRALMSQSINAVKVLDLSLGSYIKQLAELLEFYRTQADEVLGISRQRKGQVSTRDGKGVNEQSIFQSSVITNVIFREHEEFEEREFQGLLDLSKHAYRKGKKQFYIGLNNKTQELLLDDDFQETEYGVKASIASKEINKLEKIKANAQAFAQNGSLPSTIAKMEEADSLVELMDILEKEEEKQLSNNQQASQSEQQAEQQKLNIENQQFEKELEYKYYKTDQDNQTKLATGLDQPIPNIEQPIDNSLDIQKESNKLDIENKKIEILREKNQVEREKIAASLKNPVAGEK